MPHISTFVDQPRGAGNVNVNQFIQGTLTAAVGSFGRFAGTVRQSSVYGTISPNRQFVDFDTRLGLEVGTIAVGSVRYVTGTPTSNNDIKFSARGHVWVSNHRYIHQVGTIGLRAGTNSRFGTTRIGSARYGSALRGLDISPRGELWVVDTATILRYGTLGLRAGTNSRFGTQAIGSAAWDVTALGITVSSRGELWATDQGFNYVYRFGTLPLRAGTNSRQGTRAIGSFSYFGLGGGVNIVEGITFSRRGELWLVDDAGGGYIHRVGTLGLRSGTNSRQGTINRGSIRQAGVSQQGVGMDFDDRGRIWYVDNGAGTTRFYWHILGTTSVTRHYRNLRIDQVTGRIGSFGTTRGGFHTGRYGSFGTAVGVRVRGRFGSFSGTLAAPFHRGRGGSFQGTNYGRRVHGEFGSFSGTVRGRRVRGEFGTFGTIGGGLHRGRVGSFSGTVSAPRVRGRTDVRPENVIASIFGTTVIGSFSSTPFNNGIAVSQRGEVWGVRTLSPRYTYRFGTVGLRAGTPSRIGTIAIGSFRPPGAAAGPTSVMVDRDGRVWISDETTPGDRIFAIGTLALRGGTNSRLGTIRIGSFKTPESTAGWSAAKFDRFGRLWVAADDASDFAGSNYTFVFGTLGLRAGTNSRIGTQAIGSMRNPSAGISGLAFSPDGELWLSGARLYRIGTVGLRGGTNRRFGSRQIGSITANLDDIDFDSRGNLWAINTAGIPFRFGTTLGTTHIQNQRIDNVFGRRGSFTGTVVGPRMRGRGGTYHTFQRLGTKVAGSLAGGTAVRRYAVWGSAFSSAAYTPWVQYAPAVPAPIGSRDLSVLPLRRTAGSMVYRINNSEPEAIRIGSTFFYAAPP